MLAMGCSNFRTLPPSAIGAKKEKAHDPKWDKQFFLCGRLSRGKHAFPCSLSSSGGTTCKRVLEIFRVPGPIAKVQAQHRRAPQRTSSAVAALSPLVSSTTTVSYPARHRDPDGTGDGITPRLRSAGRQERRVNGPETAWPCCGVEKQSAAKARVIARAEAARIHKEAERRRSGWWDL
jgi:hypothetical protein